MELIIQHTSFLIAMIVLVAVQASSSLSDDTGSSRNETALSDQLKFRVFVRELFERDGINLYDVRPDAGGPPVNVSCHINIESFGTFDGMTMVCILTERCCKAQV
ncbi:uncharacterized protein [Ptychodera flava]|uniref:uncharacterized protein n=1 Tax=Ptychodera flava TaxID=63121 RepID=UPI00396A3959